jgi:5-methylcytosine-specific restriction endonuclease McrA
MSDATRHSRRISPGLRQKLFFLSGETCQRCGDPITFDRFHVAHLRAHSHGGPAIEQNTEAWCAPCNIKNGNKDVRDTRVTLRAWQEDALPIAPVRRSSPE